MLMKTKSDMPGCMSAPTLLNFLEKKCTRFISDYLDYKTGRRDKEWKHSFVVMAENIVYIFKRKSSQKELIRIPLLAYDRVEKYESTSVKHSYCFSVISTETNMKSAVFSCHKEDQRKTWMIKVKEHLYRAKSVESPITNKMTNDKLDDEPVSSRGRRRYVGLQLDTEMSNFESDCEYALSQNDHCSCRKCRRGVEEITDVVSRNGVEEPTDVVSRSGVEEPTDVVSTSAHDRATNLNRNNYLHAFSSMEVNFSRDVQEYSSHGCQSVHEEVSSSEETDPYSPVSQSVVSETKETSRKVPFFPLSPKGVDDERNTYLTFPSSPPCTGKVNDTEETIRKVPFSPLYSTNAIDTEETTRKVPSSSLYSSKVIDKEETTRKIPFSPLSPTGVSDTEQRTRKIPFSLLSLAGVSDSEETTRKIPLSPLSPTVVSDTEETTRKVPFSILSPKGFSVAEENYFKNATVVSDTEETTRKITFSPLSPTVVSDREETTRKVPFSPLSPTLVSDREDTSRKVTFSPPHSSETTDTEDTMRSVPFSPPYPGEVSRELETYRRISSPCPGDDRIDECPPPQAGPTVSEKSIKITSKTLLKSCLIIDTALEKDREKCNAMLRENGRVGTYLIRKSRKNEHLVLAVLTEFDKIIEYYLVSTNNRFRLCLGGLIEKRVCFDSAEDLLRHYTFESYLPGLKHYLSHGIHEIRYTHVYNEIPESHDE